MNPRNKRNKQSVFSKMILRKMPKKVKDIINEKQRELRRECLCMKGKETVIYTIIREWHSMIEMNKFLMK